MILVTGTKRSGTSMWMQALQAAGFPAFGEAFPRNWGNTLRDANPAGFYESTLRQGIFFATNPHPETGAYFFPEQVTSHAVKVFIPGVIRTDRAYIGSVIATMRPWREYVASLTRLTELERAGRDGRDDSDRPKMPPALEWWNENYCLVRDVVTRQYRFHYVAYESVLANPREAFGATFEWLGRGDIDAAAESIDPNLRTQASPELTLDVGLSPSQQETFDAFYAHVRESKPFEPTFIDRLNATNQELAPTIREHLSAQDRWRTRRGPNAPKAGV